MVAPSFGINRLVAMIDLNDFISLGQTSRDLPNFYPMMDKIRAFGWEAAECDGHDSGAIVEAVRRRKGDKPFMLLGHTTKGKGVKYMENVPIWHYRSPNPEEYKLALKQLEEAYQS
jgi:transketolase